MDIKVISDYVLHAGTVYKTDDIIVGVLPYVAERLCKLGRAEVIHGSENEHFDEAEASEKEKLSSLTKAELMKLGAERGIELNKKMTNAAIIEKILEADSSAEEM